MWMVSAARTGFRFLSAADRFRRMWSMPRPVLQMVASGVACCAALGFVLGLTSASPRPRLPGEAAAPADGDPGVVAEAQPVVEAAPPPKPEEETPVEKAEVAPPVRIEPESPQPLLMKPVDAAPAPDKVGELLDAANAQAAEEPPH
jgi:hypothetical protein